MSRSLRVARSRRTGADVGLGRRVGRSGDTGRIGLFYAIVLPGLMVMIGLAGDGAGYIRTAQRAHNIAAEAARAGAQAIRLPEAINGETKTVDAEKAIRAVSDYLTTAGIDDWEASVSDDGQRLEVTVTVDYDPLVVDIVPGVSTISATAVVTASLLVG